MRSADAGEAKRTNAKKEEKTQLKKATLKGAKNRNAKTCKKKQQIRPGANWTNMISEKVEKPGQKAKRKRKKSKSDQGPAGQT